MTWCVRISRPGWMILVALACAALSVGATASEPGELERHIELLDRAAAARVSMEFDGTPLEEAFEAIRDAARIPAILDKREILETGFSLQAPVRLILRDTPALTAMELLGGALGEGVGNFRVEAYGGLLRLTSDAAGDRIRFTQQYVIQDIVTDAARVQRLRGALGDGDPEDVAFNVADLNAEAALRDLIMLLQEMAHPEDWFDMGGQRAKLGVLGCGIYVTGPPSTHRLIQQALRELRRPQTAAFVFEAMLVRVDRSVVGDAMGRHPAGSRVLARALTRGQDVRFRSIGTVSAGGTWRVERGRGDERLGIAFAPMSDPDRGVLRCMIGAQVIGSAGAQSVDTDVDLAPDQQAIITEIPGDPQAEHVLLLVILMEQTR